MDDTTTDLTVTALLRQRHTEVKGPHPHGPSGPVGNLLVGPFAAMVDKVRDALGA